MEQHNDAPAEPVHVNPKADTSKHAWVNLGTVRIHDPVPPPGRDLLMTTFKCLIAGEVRHEWRDALTGEEVVQNA